ncbi:MAG: 3-hydroxyacyl-CoA dehydrogenase family protein, partial [Cephaloticoccus sp.]
ARGPAAAAATYEAAVKRGRLTADAAAAALARLQTTTAWDGFESCDVIVEAIIEQVAAKRALFAEIAAVARADALLASNTSALPLEEIIPAGVDAGRVVGLHFFNPVARMPLVELILGRGTARGAAEMALRFTQGLGKSPVICRSSPGFLVTRVLFFYLNAACQLWDEGVPTAVLDAAMREWGWPMGPLRLIDEVGVDVTDFIFREMAHYFPGRFERSAACERLLAAGLKGRKGGAGAGFYLHAGRDAAPNPAVAAAAENSALAPAVIAERLMVVMVDEARRCVAEGVVASVDDADFALLSGAGFPAARGGLLRWAEQRA